MSQVGTAMDDFIEQKLLDTHTAYIAKVVSVNGNRLNIQPLHMYKEYGVSASAYPIISNVPFIQRKFVITEDTHIHNIADTSIGDITTEPYTHKHEIYEESYSVGDIVLVIVCERDITNSLKGNLALPLTNSRHNLNNSVVVGRIAS